MLYEKIYLSLCFIISFVIAGCSTKEISQEEIYAKTFPAPASGLSGLYVFRESKIFGTGSDITLVLDGKKIANLEAESFYYLTISSGKHTVYLSKFRRLIYPDSEYPCVRLYLDEGKTAFLRAEYYGGRLIEVSEDEGWLHPCRRYEQDERSLGALFRNTKEQLQDIPFLTALDSLMKLFLDIPKKLEEAGLLKKGCIAKAEAIITELLGEWFNGICNFLQEILPKPST